MKTTALITSMDTPLGRAAGNWLEVQEAVTCLEGNAPADLEELVIDCATHLPGGNAERAREELASGRPRAKFDEMLTAQGADLDAFGVKLKKDSTAPVVKEFISSTEGFVRQCDARIIGEMVRDLGGGRSSQDSDIQPEVGVDQLRRPGEEVRTGEVLARVHAMSEGGAATMLSRLPEAIEISTDPPELLVLVADVVE